MEENLQNKYLEFMQYNSRRREFLVIMPRYEDLLQYGTTAVDLAAHLGANPKLRAIDDMVRFRTSLMAEMDSPQRKNSEVAPERIPYLERAYEDTLGTLDIRSQNLIRQRIGGAMDFLPLSLEEVQHGFSPMTKAFQDVTSIYQRCHEQFEKILNADILPPLPPPIGPTALLPFGYNGNLHLAVAVIEAFRDLGQTLEEQGRNMHADFIRQVFFDGKSEMWADRDYAAVTSGILSLLNGDTTWRVCFRKELLERMRTVTEQAMYQSRSSLFDDLGCDQEQCSFNWERALRVNFLTNSRSWQYLPEGDALLIASGEVVNDKAIIKAVVDTARDLSPLPTKTCWLMQPRPATWKTICQERRTGTMNSVCRLLISIPGWSMMTTWCIYLAAK